MSKTLWWSVTVFILSGALFYSQALAQTEDTAQLSFSKTAVSKKPAHTYTVQEGDVLSEIINKLPGVMLKSLNPEIQDVNRIYIGQIVRLPEGKMLTASGRMPEISLESEEPEVKEAEKVAGKDTVVLPPPARLQVIKHVITQMNGTLTTAGNYYLPVSGTEQITIDCSVIPVVEIENQTIFLDTGNRSIDHLKKMIRGYWSNYHLIRIDARDDVIT
ncbi:MAG: hypothetical protein CVU70_02360, partial [Deltaproteobacteria bacterium HGW-Deltaproteobacteria-5]